MTACSSTKVLGNESRLGDFSKQFTIDGRLEADPELVIWRRLKASWATALRLASPVSWREQHVLPNFPGSSRLRSLEDASLAATGTGKRAQKRRKRGRAAGLWAFALESVLRANYDERLNNGSRGQRRMFRQLVALDNVKTLLQAGYDFTSATLVRLQLLTRLRILTKTTVLISTVDSSDSSLGRLKSDITEAAKKLRISSKKTKLPPLTIDTVVLDEAGCVLETAIPVLLSLGAKNLTLVGDHNQLRPFSQVQGGNAIMNHSRSLMERAISSGLSPQFLDTQYRMHPVICDVRSMGNVTYILAVPAFLVEVFPSIHVCSVCRRHTYALPLYCYSCSVQYFSSRTKAPLSILLQFNASLNHQACTHLFTLNDPVRFFRLFRARSTTTSFFPRRS